jgi:hypothetical protein
MSAKKTIIKMTTIKIKTIDIAIIKFLFLLDPDDWLVSDDCFKSLTVISISFMLSSKAFSFV